jgi:septal ring factor EnvC (AmiA/AmiB activator)
VSSVPRHSEEELRQQWAFLDALVDRQAASLKSGIQDPEEDDLTVPMVTANTDYLEEISTLTQRVTSLEDERMTLLRRIDLSEEARLAAESARAAADAARLAAERALEAERGRVATAPDAPRIPPAPAPRIPPAPAPRIPPAPAPRVPPAPPVAGAAPGQGRATPPAAAKSRRKSWWQRIRE